MEIRIGFGYDVHRFKETKPLILGGVTFPEFNGLEGHSDADVLVHAICDALLGAANLGDLGTHFPDTDNKYLNISSLILLKEVMHLVNRQGYSLSNIDSTICLENPRLADHIPSMKQRIAKSLACDVGKISIKATTTEKLGFTGREEGIAVYAVVLISRQ